MSDEIMQAELEMRYAKNQLMPRLREYYKDLPIIKLLEAGGMPVAFYTDMLIHVAVHKQCDLPTLVGCLRHFMGDTKQTAMAVEIGLALSLAQWNENTEKVIVLPGYDIPKHIQLEMDSYQYPLPMVIEPDRLVHNKMTGYKTIKGSVILRGNHHDEDVCLDHLNRLNQMKLALNMDVVRHIQNTWKKLGPRKEDEDYDKYMKKVKAFTKYDTASRDVIDFLQMAGTDIWLTHSYDKRGRTYANGYHVNYQGNDWNKACVMFAEGELVTD